MDDNSSEERPPSPLAHLLAAVFKQCAQNGDMMASMKISIVSLIYKNKGKRHDLSKYRPIAVSSIIYRILARTMVIAIDPLLHHLTDHAQKAFKPEEAIADNTRLVQEITAYCSQTQTPGFLLFADQDNAYPRVRWDYLSAVMHTMNIHSDFISLVETMYSGTRLNFKINGIINPSPISPTNGLAQGCPLSPCLYLLCVQGLLSMIRCDERSLDPGSLIGIPIPDTAGITNPNDPVRVTLSAFADDICLFLRDSNQLPRFRTLLTTYELGAGAKNSWEKTVGECSWDMT